LLRIFSANSFENGVGWYADIDTFPSDFFDEPLGIELQFFGQIVNAKPLT